jgi:hypothetical protein
VAELQPSHRDPSQARQHVEPLTVTRFTQNSTPVHWHYVTGSSRHNVPNVGTNRPPSYEQICLKEDMLKQSLLDHNLVEMDSNPNCCRMCLNTFVKLLAFLRNAK